MKWFGWWVWVLVMIQQAPLACANPTPLAANDAWTTLGDETGPVKVCGIQTVANRGLFTMFGSSDRPGVLRLGLFKDTWHISAVRVPVILTFGDGTTFRLSGLGLDKRIRADVPEPDARAFVHHLTADHDATLTLPEGHEMPWRLDLRGTTPATLAMAPCIDATGITLPAPFRAPRPIVVSSNIPMPTHAVANSPPYPAANTAQVESPPEKLSTASEPVVDQGRNTTTQLVVPKPTITVTEATPDYADLAPAHDFSVGASNNNSMLNGVLASVGGFIFVFIVAGVALYFIPYIIGSSRSIDNRLLLFLVNLLFGWTLFGWLACLLWAALAQSGMQRQLYEKVIRDQRA